MNSQDDGFIFYRTEVVDYFRDIRCAGQAILYLIDNFNSLEYNTNNVNEIKETVKRGIPTVRESI